MIDTLYLQPFVLDAFTFLKRVFLVPIFCVTLFLPLLVLFGPIWLLLYIAQRGVFVVAKRVPGLRHPLRDIDVFFLEDYNRRHSWSTVVNAIFDGDISASTVQSIFAAKVLSAKVKVRGKGEEEEDNSWRRLKFPELQQCQTSFLGFAFWKENPSFRLENHFQEVFCDDDDKDAPPHSFTRSFESIYAEFTARPYPPGQSPWEVWILRRFLDGNDGTLKTVFVWRAHHSLMDGYSMLSLANELFGTSPVPNSNLPVAATLQGNKPLSSLSIWSVLGGLVSYVSLQFRNRRFKAWSLAQRRKKGANNTGGANPVPIQNKTHFKFSPTLPLDRVKEVAGGLGVRVPALLTTLVAESISQVLQAADDDDMQDAHAIFVCPLPNHPGTLVNHAALAQLPFPLSNVQPLAERLSSINDAFLGLKSNPSMLIIQVLAYLMGKIPPAIYHSFLDSVNYSPILITNVGLGAEEYQCGRIKCSKILAGVGVPYNRLSSSAQLVGYKNEVQILLSCHDSLFTEQDVEGIVAEIGVNFQRLCAAVPEFKA